MSSTTISLNYNERFIIFMNQNASDLVIGTRLWKVLEAAEIKCQELNPNDLKTWSIGLISTKITEEMMEIVGHKNAVLDDASSLMSLNN